MEEKCRICNSQTGFEDHGRIINGYPLFQCPACGTVFVKTPSKNSLDNSEEYDDLFSQGAYEMHRKVFNQYLAKGRVPLEFYRQYLLKKLEKYVDGRDCVEIGGGVGTFGKFCVNRGWNYIDYDISSVAVNFARQLGLNAEVLDPELPKIRPANVVVMWEVIEHVWNVYDYLCSINESLLPGGILLLSTPNYKRKGYRASDNWGVAGSPPVHVNFFTKESVQNVLHCAGFQYVKVICPRFYRPSSVRNLRYSLEIALRIEPTKSLYVVASKELPEKSLNFGWIEL